MARAGLKWSAQELADAASVGYATVARFESGQKVQPDSVSAMRSALEAVGVTLIDAGGKSECGGAGVRLPGIG